MKLWLSGLLQFDKFQWEKKHLHEDNLILRLFAKNSKQSHPNKGRSWRKVNNEADGTIFDVATCNLLKRNIVILFGKKYNENVHGILLLDSSEIYKILHISEILILWFESNLWYIWDIRVGGGADFVLWIDYLIHIQNSIGDTRIGLVFSEDEKTPPYGDRQNRVI